MKIGSQKPEIPERFGDIKKKTDCVAHAQGNLAQVYQLTAFLFAMIQKVSPLGSRGRHRELS
jgi:hypothetical protein